jgi:hypothetical protein
MDATASLIQRLQRAEAFDHPVVDFAVRETHISWVLCTGFFAYKIKKPVDLGFLDFSTLEKRRHFCEEELRLNSRFAPKLYLEVVAVTGDPERPRLGGGSPVLDYAVKMRQFAEADRLDHVLESGRLSPALVDETAAEAARFHRLAAAAPVGSPFGSPEKILERVQDNFNLIRRVEDFHRAHQEQVAALECWSAGAHRRLTPVFQARKAGGFVRECHGDMHLGNMALIDGRVTLFDGIEFNDAFRWIDVASDLAFLTMDLEERGRRDFAFRALNLYLDLAGDHELLRVLRFYEVYRALVRAKVACIRMGQGELAESVRAELQEEARRYLELAWEQIQPPRRALWLMQGVSGSGKTRFSQEFLERFGAIRLRSDVERKRLYGLDPLARSEGALKAELYGPEASRRTFTLLRDKARSALEAGYRVIVDATFLARPQRRMFLELAQSLSLPIHLLRVETPIEIVRSRIEERGLKGADASEADLEVLEHQLRNEDPLDAEEQSWTLTVDGRKSGFSSAEIRRIDEWS